MIKRVLKVTSYMLYLLLFIEVSLQSFYYFSSGEVLWKRTAIPIYRPDRYMVYSVKSNLTYHHATNEFDSYLYTNGEGFRTSRFHEEYSLGKDDSRFRILLLGPSFAFGWGVNYEDTFANQLKNYLGAGGFAAGREIEVINAGVPSLAPMNQLNWFDNYGKKYSPDLVVQLIYGTMIRGDELDTTLKANSDGYLVTTNATRAKKIQSWLKNFAVVHYGWVFYTTISSAAGASLKQKRVEGAGIELKEQTQFDLNEESTRRAVNFYQRLGNSISAAETKLLIVHFPLSYRVHREDVSRWKHLGVEDFTLDLSFNETFCGHLSQQGIPCLNITQDLIGEGQRSQERLYYWLDIHWTPNGNRVAAQSVARYLLGQSTQ
jgi:hypothetical protein